MPIESPLKKPTPAGPISTAEGEAFCESIRKQAMGMQSDECFKFVVDSMRAFFNATPSEAHALSRYFTAFLMLNEAELFLELSDVFMMKQVTAGGVQFLRDIRRAETKPEREREAQVGGKVTAQEAETFYNNDVKAQCIALSSCTEAFNHLEAAFAKSFDTTPQETDAMLLFFMAVRALHGTNIFHPWIGDGDDGLMKKTTAASVEYLGYIRSEEPEPSGSISTAIKERPAPTPEDGRAFYAEIQKECKRLVRYEDSYKPAFDFMVGETCKHFKATPDEVRALQGFGTIAALMQEQDLYMAWTEGDSDDALMQKLTAAAVAYLHDIRMR